MRLQAQVSSQVLQELSGSIYKPKLIRITRGTKWKDCFTRGWLPVQSPPWQVPPVSLLGLCPGGLNRCVLFLVVTQSEHEAKTTRIAASL